jgi:diguanylate cyclase with GGDEF domain
MAFRFGGDEFVLVLPNHTIKEGMALAERLRVTVNSVPRTSQNLALTVSVGIAVWPRDGNDAETLLKSADDALYQAKAERRNLVRAASSAIPRRVLSSRAPTIKWVDMNYPQQSGLQEQKNAAGFTLTWRRDDKPRNDDGEPVVIDDGESPTILKVHNADSPLTLFQKRE